jgi:predicted small secreted protein
MRQLILLLFVACATFLSAQNTHRITVQIEGYDQDVLSLANNVLDKQYIVDTASRNGDGLFVFESDTSALPKGIYLVVLAPDNEYFQLVIGDDPDQEFKLATSTKNLAKVTVSNSKENKLFFDYLGYLDQMQELTVPQREQLKDTTLTDARRS